MMASASPRRERNPTTNRFFGDGDVCRNTEGGQVSAAFAGLVTGLVETAARIVGGIFSGIGGVGAAIAPDD